MKYAFEAEYEPSTLESKTFKIYEEDLPWSDDEDDLRNFYLEECDIAFREQVWAEALRVDEFVEWAKAMIAERDKE